MQLSISKLKQVRANKGWSQEVLATASGLSLRTIQRIEAEGKASAESVLALAAAYEVFPTELQSSQQTIDVNWTRKMIMLGIIGLITLFVTVGAFMFLGGFAALEIDWIGLYGLIAFLLATTIITFGLEGLSRSAAGLKYIFTNELKGGKPAQYLASIYGAQIKFCYGGAIIGFIIGSVAMHGAIDKYPDENLHLGYAINLQILMFAAILSEAILRPLKTKLETCDLSAE